MSVSIHPLLQYYVPFWPVPRPVQIPESYLRPEVQLLLMQLLQQLQGNKSETVTCDEYRNLARQEELATSNERRQCDRRIAQSGRGLPQGSILDCMDSYSTNDTRQGEILLQIGLEKSKRSNLTRILEEKNKELMQLQKRATNFIDVSSVPQDGRDFLEFRKELNKLHDKLWRMQYSFVGHLTQLEESIQEFFKTNGSQENHPSNKRKVAPNYMPRRRDFRSRGDAIYDEEDIFFLKEAILTNNLDSVKNIIADKKVDINEIIDGKTPIMHAIEANALDIGEYLIYNGADVEVVSDSTTPLQKAVAWNRIQFAELLLKNNADVNAKSNGETALYNAADKDLYDMSKLLLDHGADPNIFCGSFSPLHVVRHAGIAKLLVDKGADVNAYSPNRRNWTPVHHSADKNYHEKAVFLIRHGAELDLMDDWEITPLTLTATTNNQKLAHLLLLHRADPNKTNKTLLTAVRRGHLKLVKLLLQFNANVHTSDDRGWTAFHEAVSRDDEEMVALFLDFGAEPDNAYGYQITPREYAKEYELDVLSVFP